MSANLVNIIFGMKVRQARMEAGLTLSELASQCDLSASYVTEIEKGRKYPRADKIMKIAEALHKEYDDLVSIKLAPSLTYLESAISSSIFQHFPFEEFGLEAGDLVTLLTREPDKASAMLHAILTIGRRYDLKEEEFLRAALRSYQEIHENYFSELEDAALAFTAEFGAQYALSAAPPLAPDVLETILRQEYGYHIDHTTLGENPLLTRYRSVFQEGRGGATLFVNPALRPRQVKFVLARELGYQYLKLKERSTTSTPDKISSFQQILNDFRAAYFGGTLLMPKAALLADLQAFFDQPQWQPQALLAMLDRFEVTPEMLLYRLSELVPQFYGIKLHFLRFHDAGGSYQLVKQLNMNQLIVPSGIGLHEHYCRRWLTVRLLKELPAADQDQFDHPWVGVQLSEFLNAQDRFLCIGFARPLVLSPDVHSSVIVGFRVDAELRRTIRFMADPAIPRAIINETCERCPLTAEQCHERAAAPSILEAQQRETARKLALSQLRPPG